MARKSPANGWSRRGESQSGPRLCRKDQPQRPLLLHNDSDQSGMLRRGFATAAILTGGAGESPCQRRASVSSWRAERPGLKQMPPRFKRFIQSWIITTLAVLVVAKIVPGFHYESLVDLAVASLLLGILNAFLRPILLLLALPLLIFSLGLFLLVLNGLLLYFVGYLLHPHFYVDGFWPAFWGALIISVVSIVLNTLTGVNTARVEVRRSRQPRPPDDAGGGPVIDV